MPIGLIDVRWLFPESMQTCPLESLREVAKNTSKSFGLFGTEIPNATQLDRSTEVVKCIAEIIGEKFDMSKDLDRRHLCQKYMVKFQDLSSLGNYNCLIKDSSVFTGNPQSSKTSTSSENSLSSKNQVLSQHQRCEFMKRPLRERLIHLLASNPSKIEDIYLWEVQEKISEVSLFGTIERICGQGKYGFIRSIEFTEDIYFSVRNIGSEERERIKVEKILELVGTNIYFEITNINKITNRQKKSLEAQNIRFADNLGLTSSRRKLIQDMLMDICFMRNDKYLLLRHIWKEVDENWPFFSDHERQRMKVLKSEKVAFFQRENNKIEAAKQTVGKSTLPQGESTEQIILKEEPKEDDFHRQVQSLPVPVPKKQTVLKEEPIEDDFTSSVESLPDPVPARKQTKGDEDIVDENVTIKEEKVEDAIHADPDPDQEVGKIKKHADANVSAVPQKCSSEIKKENDDNGDVIMMEEITVTESKLVQAMREFDVKNPTLKGNTIHVLDHLQKNFNNQLNRPFVDFGFGTFIEFSKKHGLKVDLTYLVDSTTKDLKDSGSIKKTCSQNLLQTANENPEGSSFKLIKREEATENISNNATKIKIRTDLFNTNPINEMSKNERKSFEDKNSSDFQHCEDTTVNSSQNFQKKECD